MHRLQDLVRFHRTGTGARLVARRLRMSPNTERAHRRALEAQGLLVGDPDALPELETLRHASRRSCPEDAVAAVLEHQPLDGCDRRAAHRRRNADGDLDRGLARRCSAREPRWCSTSTAA
jgi:hypothetical protein